MIILTAEEAEKVRGISPTNGKAALDPFPLKDGTFILPEDVLLDPAHADVHSFLQARPRQEVADEKMYKSGDDIPLVKEKLRSVRDAKAGLEK